MTSEKQLKLAYGLAIILFLLGVLGYGYAALLPPTHDQPLRMRFTTSAGSVIFDHKTHTDITGYGISCGDCHHTLAEDEFENAGSCTECHEIDEGDEDMPKRADAFHRQCTGCHQDYEKGPVAEDCNACHVM